MTFRNYEFCIFPMNLVALAQDFQNQICFIAQGNYSGFWANFLCDITFTHVFLRWHWNFVTISTYSITDERRTKEIKKVVWSNLQEQEGKQITFEKSQIYIIQNKFWFVGRKVKEALRKCHGRGGSTENLASRDLWMIPKIRRTPTFWTGFR